MQDILQKTTDALQLGGPVLVILMILSIVALAIILLKLYQFLSLSLGKRKFIPYVLAQYRAGRPDDALQILKRQASPVARVLEVAIEGQQRDDLNEHILREEVDRVAVDHLEQMRSYLRGLEVIAALSPLLGLLGTVLGMIDAFQQLEEAGDRVNASILSGGIWEALLTTAAGLAIAIPVLAVLNWLERIIQRTAHAMESAATQVFTVAVNQEPWTHGIGHLQSAHQELTE
jgi:biopolymer transport protein ExbB